MNQPYAELELSLQQVRAHTYTVEVRLGDAHGTLAAPSPARRPPLAHIRSADRQRLLALSYQPDAYGSELARLLFADRQLQREFAERLAEARAIAAHVRICLSLRPGAAGPSDLHDLRWETLWHPTEGRPLAISERECLVRAINSESLRPPLQSTRGALRSLVAVVAPPIPEQGLAPIDVGAELGRAERLVELVGGASPVQLGGAGEVTLADLVAGLQGSPDLLYLVSHGLQSEAADPPGYYLAMRSGDRPFTHRDQLIEQLRGRVQLPKLAILLSCYGAGEGWGGEGAAEASNRALAALGPGMAMAGVPAVIAAQGPFSTASAELFGRVLFESLVHHGGHVDRAVAAARAALRAAGRPDWWAPVVFMHQGAGPIWRELDGHHGYRERLRGWLPAYATHSPRLLHDVAEALLACPSATGIDWERMDSLDALVEGLRVHDNGAPALARLDDLLGRELPRPISWPETAELTRLLGPVLLPDDELADLFALCRSPACELPAGRTGQTTMARMVRRFATLSVQPGGSRGRQAPWHPLIELLRELLAAYAHRPGVGAAAPGLVAWAAPVAARLGLQPLALARPGGGSPPEPERARDPSGSGKRQAYLTIVVIPAVGERQPMPSPLFDRKPDPSRPDTIRVLPYAWLSHDPPPGGGAVAQTPVPIPGLPEGAACTLAQLRAGLADLLKGAARLAQGAALAVELCLPVPLLLLDVDAWEALHFYGETTPLGQLYPTAVRVLDRVYGDGQGLPREPWLKKWEQYREVAAALREHVRWFWGAQGDTPERVAGDLLGKYVALGYISPSAPGAAREPDRVLIRAILAGVPAALILREGGDPQRGARLLDPEHLGAASLPQAALQWRQLALSDQATFGDCCHLTVLWDDASRPPPLPPFVQPAHEQD